MTLDFDAAWQAAADPAADRLAALTVLAANRHRLPGYLFMEIPEGEEGNPAWLALCDATDGVLCNCGRRRLMRPLEPRVEIRPAGEPIMVTADNPLVISPWGGDVQSALQRLEIKQDDFVATVNPYRTGALVPFFFVHNRVEGGDVRRVPLSTSVEFLSGAPQPFGHMLGDFQQVIGRITAVDLTTLTVLVQLDAAVQTVTDQTYYARHSCV